VRKNITSQVSIVLEDRNKSQNEENHVDRNNLAGLNIREEITSWSNEMSDFV
jgi:hypothetical protein